MCARLWMRRPEGVSFHAVTHSHVCGHGVTSHPNLQSLGRGAGLWPGRAVPTVHKALSAPSPETVGLAQKRDKWPFIIVHVEKKR